MRKKILHLFGSFGPKHLDCTSMKISPILKRFAFLILILPSLFFACETNEIKPEAIPSGTEYFPIAVGNYWVYRVDSIEYTFTNQKLIGTYFRKEKISDTLPDQEGARVFRIEIYKTSDTLKPWILDSVWSVRVGKDKIIKAENNVPFVKLLFPLQESSQWDGNQYNTGQDSGSVYWYKVRNLGKMVTFRNQIVESVEIVQKIDSNCLNNAYFTEVYYRNIGLGFKRRSYKTYVSCVGIPVIEQGKTTDFTLIDYGKE